MHIRLFGRVLHVDVLGRLIAVEKRTVEVEDKFLPADSQLPWSIASLPQLSACCVRIVGQSLLVSYYR